MKLISHILALCALTALSGCAYFNTAYRSFSVDDGSGALIDIKQRAIIATRRIDKDNKDIKKTDIFGRQHPVEKTIVCAEPSPDAISAYAAELAGSGILPSGEAIKLAAAFQEGTSFVGLRTQTIQLLRDEMYRLCEDYMNGVDSKAEHELKLRRNQKMRVALLAIEGLTGAVKAPVVAINTKGSAETGRSLSEYTDELTKTNKKIDELSNKLAENSKQIADLDKEIKANEGKTDDSKKKLEKDKADKTIAESDKKLLEKEKEFVVANKEALEKGIQNARDLVANGGTSTDVSSVGIPASPQQANNIETVAKIVGKIATDAMKMDDLGVECLVMIKEKEISMNDPVYNECVKLINLATTSNSGNGVGVRWYDVNLPNLSHDAIAIMK